VLKLDAGLLTGVLLYGYLFTASRPDGRVARPALRR
jgi:hypothetical protein